MAYHKTRPVNVSIIGGYPYVNDYLAPGDAFLTDTPSAVRLRSFDGWLW